MTVNTKRKKGFTLVELLVTISIIALLSAMGMAVYSVVLKQGRDSKRKADLGTIQSALEQYSSDQGFYPHSNSNPVVAGSSLTSSTNNPSPRPSERTYLRDVPADPRSSPHPQYSYVALPASCNNAAAKCINYCLYAKLENPPASLPVAPVNCSYDTNRNYAVSSP